MKTRLRPLIYHGGGELSSKVLTHSIRLADPDGGGNLSGFISTDYIFDSIKHNRLQDIENYWLKASSRSTLKNSDSRKKTSPSTSKIPGSSGGGRQAYTNEEDLALMLFVKEHKAYHPIKGNSLYKEAAKAKVTSHTWQSMRDHYIKVLHNRKKPRDFEKLIFKAGREKPQGEVLKEKILNCQSDKGKKEQKEDKKKELSSKRENTIEKLLEKGQSRNTRSQTASPKKKIDDGKKDSGPADTEQNVATGQSRKTRSQMASPKKRIDDDKKDSRLADTEQNAISEQSRKTRSKTASPKKRIDDDTEHDAVSDNLPDVTGPDNSEDESSAGEDMDYDKMFDDNLLKLAHESKVEKDCNKVDNNVVEEGDINDENEVALSQNAQKMVITRREKLVDEQVNINEFDGEVNVKEDLKRPSADEDDDKRPVAKRSKRDLVSSPVVKEPQVKDQFSKCYEELQLNLQRLESKWTVPQIIHALLVNSGKLDEAEKYLQHGKAGKEHWSPEEDKILLSKDKEAISSLAKTRGLQSVVDRMNFIEGIS